MPNFVIIGPSTAEILQFLQNRQCCHLNVRNTNILLSNRVCRAEMHHRAKFCQN